MDLRIKVQLGLPLTARERARFLLFIATKEEMHKFLKKEKEGTYEYCWF